MPNDEARTPVTPQRVREIADILLKEHWGDCYADLMRLSGQLERNATALRAAEALPIHVPEDREAMMSSGRMKESLMHDPLYGSQPKWYPSAVLVDAGLLVALRDALEKL